MERALGAEHFAALQRELGAQASYRMTEAQAEAVVRLQLGQLAALERDEIFKEYNELRDEDPRLRGAARRRAQHPGRHPRRPGSSCATSTATSADARSSTRTAGSTTKT